MGRRADRFAGAALIAVLCLCLGCVANDAFREATFAGESVIAPESGEYTARVGLPFRLRAEQDADVIDVTLGGDDVSAMSCWIYKSPAELGATSMRLVRLGRSHFDENLGDFAVEQLSGLGAGVVGASAYHSVEWLYTDPEKGGAQIKAATANKHGRGIACLDLNLGYQASFFEVFETLVTSFESSTPPPEPYFTEVFVSSLGGLKVGVSSVAFSLDAEGDTEVFSDTSMLVPRSGQDVVVSYSSQRTWSRPNGTMINAYATESDIDQMHTELSLRYGKSESWEVAGVVKGKEFSASLERTEWIDTSLAEYYGLQDKVLPKGDKTQLELVIWEPSADPASVLQATYRVDPDDPSRLSIEVGPLKFEGNRGPEGLMDDAVMDMGSSALDLELVYRGGAL
jgi:hypothetical protein